MEKKHIIILGAGISGLSAAWYLKQIAPQYQITILEKEDRAGGWIKGYRNKGFSFEQGPRIFKVSKNYNFLSLIDELSMQNEVVISSGAKNRYIFQNETLHKLPSSIFSFLTSSYTRELFLSICKEPFIKPSLVADESVGSFIERRFSKKLLDKLFDPLVQGIYAADPYELSIKSCFPLLKEYEDLHGSIIKGAIKKKPKEKHDRYGSGSDLFFLKNGAESLIERLIQKTSSCIHYNQNVKNISFTNGYVDVFTDTNTFCADEVFIALPVWQTAELLRSSSDELASILSSIPSVSITSALLGFNSNVLSHNGFGYLVPSSEKKNILGAVFDSEAFKIDRSDDLNTRITLMMKGSGFAKDQVNLMIKESLEHHLGICNKPDLVDVIIAEKSIPKFLPGHNEKICQLKKTLKNSLPRCFLLGNYLSGVSVNDCIKHSQNTVLEWALS